MPPKRAGSNQTSKRAKKMPKLDNEEKINIVIKKRSMTKLKELELALEQNHCNQQVLDLIEEVVKSSQLSTNLILRLLKFGIKVRNENVVQQILSQQNVDLKSPERRTILWEAVSAGNPAIAKLLLRAKADVNVCDTNECTLLHQVLESEKIISKAKKKELIKLLLEHGANVNACNSNGYSVLNIAIRSNHCSSQLVEVLLQHGANVNCGEESPLNDIILACQHKLQLLPMLIEHKVPDEDTRNKRSVIAIKTLLSNGRKSITMCLIKNILDLGVPSSMVLDFTLSLKNKDMLKLLFKYGVDLKCPKLMQRLIEDHLDELILLVLKYGGDVNARILQQAIYHNTSVEIVTELLKRGADVDADDCLAIYVVARKMAPVPKLLSTLVNWGNPNLETQKKRIMAVVLASIHVNIRHYLPLIRNFETKGLTIYRQKNAQEFILFDEGISKLDVLIMLLDYAEKYGDDNTEAKSKRSMTPLWTLVELATVAHFKTFLMAATDQLPIYQYLDRHYRERNAKNLTLLDMAVIEKRLDMVKMLLDYSRNDQNEIHSAGSSSLFIASKRCHYSFAKLLIEGGVQIDPCNNFDLTPLFVACLYAHDTVRYQNIILLVYLGANINVVDKCYETPLIATCKYDHAKDKTVSLLLRLGADINMVNRDGRVALYYSLRPGKEKINRMLIERVAVLVMQEALVNDENLAIVNSDSAMLDYYNKCLSELQSMKEKQIHKNISVFSVLTANSKQLKLLSKNSFVILRRLKKPANSIFDYDQIKLRLKIAGKKNDVLVNKIKVLDEIFKGAIPYEVLEMIADCACRDEYMCIDIDEYSTSSNWY